MVSAATPGGSRPWRSADLRRTSDAPAPAFRLRATACEGSSAASRQSGQPLLESLGDEPGASVGPAQAAGFHELLERLSRAHDAELHSAREELESERARLERQNRELRSQLVEARARPADDDRVAPVRRGRTTSWSSKDAMSRVPSLRPPARVCSEECSERPSRPSSAAEAHLPGGSLAVAWPPLGGDGGPAADAEGSGGGATQDDARGPDVPQGEEDERDLVGNSEEGGRFPPRSQYTEELRTAPVRKKPQPKTRSLSKRLSVSAQEMLLDRLSSSTVSGATIARRFSDNSFASALSAIVVASPRSTTRTAWEIAGCVLVFWDLIVVPLAVFCYPVSSLTIAMDWVTLIFWTLNVPQTLTVGYEAGKGIVMSPSSILWRYLKGWFVIDMLVLVPDWVLKMLELGSSPRTSCDVSSGAAGGLKYFKFLRFMRLLRLTRIARLKALWRLAQEKIHSVTMSIAADIFTMLLLLLIASHFIACAWFAISDSMDGADRWLHEFERDHELRGTSATWYYQYLTSMHWALTQFTPASMSVQPWNWAERLFNIWVVVCALVGFSYVVGSITGSLAQLRSHNEEESKLFWDLRVYLKRNCVDQYLSFRIQRYLQHTWRAQSCNKTYKQVKILTLLSEQLQSELLFQLNAKHLTIHPLIEELLRVSKVTAFRLARAAISTIQVANSDFLFISGEKTSHMYIVIQGRFEYKRLASDDDVRLEMVDKDEDWIAEPVLWSAEWYHLGDCTSVDESRLILVSPQQFCEVAKRNPAAWALVTTYCRNFLQWLNSADPDDLSDITQGDDRHNTVQLRSFMVIEEQVKSPLSPCSPGEADP